jgi:hypothetical protein
MDQTDFLRQPTIPNLARKSVIGFASGFNAQRQMDKSFLLLFFKKEALAFT